EDFQAAGETHPKRESKGLTGYIERLSNPFARGSILVSFITERKRNHFRSRSIAQLVCQIGSSSADFHQLICHSIMAPAAENSGLGSRASNALRLRGPSVAKSLNIFRQT